jgi:hypothetical protein
MRYKETRPRQERNMTKTRRIYGEDISHNGPWDDGLWTRKETGGYITRIDIAVLWNAVDDAVEKRN